MINHNKWLRILDIYSWGQDEETPSAADFKKSLRRRTVALICLIVAAIFFALIYAVYWADIFDLHDAEPVFQWLFFILSGVLVWIMRVVLGIFYQAPWAIQMAIGFVAYAAYFQFLGLITYKFANYRQLNQLTLKIIWLYLTIGFLITLLYSFGSGNNYINQYG